MKRALRLLLLGLVVALPSAALHAQADADLLRSAKTAFFDRKYLEARQLWEKLLAGRGPDADQAAYWVARCSESLSEHERALREYGAFLTRRGADPALVEEARTSRISLSARLVKSGKLEHLGILKEALADKSRTVRYFAALQLASLGPEQGQAAVPVLKEIVKGESDADLVDRAKLALLRLDPGALAAAQGKTSKPAPRAAGATASWVRVRVYEKGAQEPKLSINVPFALAELVFKALPDDARRELRDEGYDADSLWEKLRSMPPTQILEVVGDGKRIQIWIE